MKKNLVTSHFPRYSAFLFRALTTPLLLFFVGIGNCILLGGALLFGHWEAPVNPEVAGFWDALWWAFSTVTTVGYGDIVPVTPEGRVVGLFLMVAGVIFFVGSTAIFVSVISSLVAENLSDEEMGQERLLRQLLAELGSVRTRLEAIERKLGDR